MNHYLFTGVFQNSHKDYSYSSLLSDFINPLIIWIKQLCPDAYGKFLIERDNSGIPHVHISFSTSFNCHTKSLITYWRFPRYQFATTNELYSFPDCHRGFFSIF